MITFRCKEPDLYIFTSSVKSNSFSHQLKERNTIYTFVINKQWTFVWRNDWLNAYVKITGQAGIFRFATLYFLNHNAGKKVKFPPLIYRWILAHNLE